ncbi:hypothetical protein [Actinomadura madurae]|uniref:hypothetical protein n=1 Tax=Actinomadura madurae TaxID=1993 RepID=UPI0020D22F09|nr:hypothetical protein [Actinomadura madurae]MCP9979580.1 hypothetical protein [Actinomadura madurae]
MRSTPGLRVGRHGRPRQLKAGSTGSGTGSASTVSYESATSVTTLKPVQAPLNRDISNPCRPSRSRSPTDAGTSTGMNASASAPSVADGSVDDFADGSSPTTASTPPRSDVPSQFACLKASSDRSTPGALPYQRPKTPW